MKKLLANQIFTTKILWGALLSSNLIFGFLVYAKLIVGSDTSVSDILAFIPYIAAIGTMSMSLFFFSRATNFEVFKRKFRSSAFNQYVENFTPQAQIVDQYEALDFKEKKQFHILQKSFLLFIQTWAMAEATTIMGIVGIFVGMNPEHFWYFFYVGIALMFYTYPKKLSSHIKSLTFISDGFENDSSISLKAKKNKGEKKEEKNDEDLKKKTKKQTVIMSFGLAMYIASGALDLYCTFNKIYGSIRHYFQLVGLFFFVCSMLYVAWPEFKKRYLP